MVAINHQDDVTKINSSHQELLDNTQLSVREKEDLYQVRAPPPPTVFTSFTMQQLKRVLVDDNAPLFQQIGFDAEVRDPEECLFLLYVSAICMNSLTVFNQILARNNYFRTIRPEWYQLFASNNTTPELFKLF